jgi:Flp pilus assembly pilin Flp
MKKQNKSELFKNLASRFIADERGQSTTEYILILAVVVMIALKFREKFNAVMGKATDKLGTDMDRMLSGE